jgi:hypothetical protein
MYLICYICVKNNNILMDMRNFQDCNNIKCDFFFLSIIMIVLLLRNNKRVQLYFMSIKKNILHLLL